MNDQLPKTLSWERKLTLLLMALPLLLGVFILLGTTYHSGRIKEFGLSDEVFWLLGDKSALTGFFSSLVLTGVGVGYGILVTVSLVVFLVVFLVGFQILMLVPEVAALVTRIGNFALNASTRMGSHGESFGQSLLDMLKALGWAMGLVIAISIVSLASAYLGKQQAITEKEKVEDHTLPLTSVFDSNGKELAGGYLVACSDKFCGFWTGERPVTISIDDIKRMEPRKVDNAKNGK